MHDGILSGIDKRREALAVQLFHIRCRRNALVRQDCDKLITGSIRLDEAGRHVVLTIKSFLGIHEVGFRFLAVLIRKIFFFNLILFVLRAPLILEGNRVEQDQQLCRRKLLHELVDHAVGIFAAPAVDLLDGLLRKVTALDLRLQHLPQGLLIIRI